MYFNIILLSMPSSSNWYLSCRCTPHTPPSHLPDLINHKAAHYALFSVLSLPPTWSHIQQPQPEHLQPVFFLESEISRVHTVCFNAYVFREQMGRPRGSRHSPISRFLYAKQKQQVPLKRQYLQTKLHNVTHYYSPS